MSQSNFVNPQDLIANAGITVQSNSQTQHNNRLAPQPDLIGDYLEQALVSEFDAPPPHLRQNVAYGATAFVGNGQLANPTVVYNHGVIHGPLQQNFWPLFDGEVPSQRFAQSANPYPATGYAATGPAMQQAHVQPYYGDGPTLQQGSPAQMAVPQNTFAYDAAPFAHMPFEMPAAYGGYDQIGQQQPMLYPHHQTDNAAQTLPLQSVPTQSEFRGNTAPARCNAPSLPAKPSALDVISGGVFAETPREMVRGELEGYEPDSRVRDFPLAQGAHLFDGAVDVAAPYRYNGQSIEEIIGEAERELQGATPPNPLPNVVDAGTAEPSRESQPVAVRGEMPQPPAPPMPAREPMAARTLAVQPHPPLKKPNAATASNPKRQSKAVKKENKPRGEVKWTPSSHQVGGPSKAAARVLKEQKPVKNMTGNGCFVNFDEVCMAKKQKEVEEKKIERQAVKKRKRDDEDDAALAAYSRRSSNKTPRIDSHQPLVDSLDQPPTGVAPAALTAVFAAPHRRPMDSSEEVAVHIPGATSSGPWINVFPPTPGVDG